MGKIGLRDLAALCRRLATSLEAGLDIRRVLEREASGRAPGALRRHLDDVRRRIAGGQSLAEAVDENHDYFPPLFCEMTDLAEHTGRLGEVYRQLADHYEHQLKMQRQFLASITWPAIQLVVALSVVGVVIWLPAQLVSNPIDILGFGLVGDQGLAIYCLLIVAAAIIGVLLFRVIRSGIAVAAPIQMALLRLPMLGPPLRTLALARLAWSLNLTLDTGMALRKALPLSLRSTRNAQFTQDCDKIMAAVSRGEEISVAFGRTGSYPAEFLERLAVGEESGRLPESMAILSRQYQEEALRSIATLTMLAGFGVWIMVAMFLGFLIIRIFMNAYLGPINDALNF